MLKIYEWNGGTWQFEEAEAPDGAVPVTDAAAKTKPASAATPEQASGKEQTATRTTQKPGRRSTKATAKTK